MNREEQFKYMTATQKLHSLVFSIATPIVFTVWKLVSGMYGTHWAFDIIIAFITSAIFYNCVYKCLLFICKKSSLLKKWFLGKNYFEGLWIGYYLDNNEKIYYYEFFEQDLEELIIKGTALNENGEHISSWTIIHPYINTNESKFAYYYEMDIIDSPDIAMGYAKATIYWDGKNCAYKLTGYTVGSFLPRKDKFVSIKVQSLKRRSDQQLWLKESFISTVREIEE